MIVPNEYRIMMLLIYIFYRKIKYTLQENLNIMRFESEVQIPSPAYLYPDKDLNIQ